MKNLKLLIHKTTLFIFISIFLFTLVFLLGSNNINVKGEPMEKDFFLITTTPSCDTSSEMNVNYHTRIGGSYIEYTESYDTNFDNAVVLQPEQVEWSTKGVKNADQDDSFATKRYVCSATFKYLKSRTKYIYRIRKGDKMSDVFSFTTSGLTNSWNFLAFVDFQPYNNNNTHPLINQMLNIANNPPRVVCSGDLTDCGAKEQEWRWLLDKDCFTKFIFGTTVGDHEYWGADKSSPYPMMDTPAGFNGVFNNPKNGHKNTLNSNYYFYYNNVLFVYIDMNDSNTSTGTKFTNQENWFRETMTALAGTYQYSVVLAHKSLYGSTTTDTGVRKYISPKWYPLMDEFGVDLFIGGHDHMYSRTYALKNNKKDDSGTYYLDMGSSGAKYRTPSDDLSTDGLHEKVIDLKALSYAVGANITVTDKNMTVEVYNTKNEKVDSFVINKKRAPLSYDYSGFDKDGLKDAFEIEVSNSNGFGKLYLDNNDNFKYIKHIKVRNNDGSIIYDNDIDTMSQKAIELSGLNSLNYKVEVTIFNGVDYEYDVKVDLGTLHNFKIENDGDGAYIKFTKETKDIVQIDYDLYIDGEFARKITEDEIKNKTIQLGNNYIIGNHDVKIAMSVSGEQIDEFEFESTGYDELKLLIDNKLEMKKGDSVILNYEFEDGSLVAVSSTDEDVVKYENGKIVAVGKGSAKIVLSIIDSDYKYEIDCDVTTSGGVYIIMGIALMLVGAGGAVSLILIKKKRKKEIAE